MTDDLFIESMRPEGDFAGVFEYDGQVGYFYLYRLPSSGEGGKIDGSIEIVKGNLTFEPDQLELRWSAEQDRVGLFIEGEIWALFNVKSGAAYGQEHAKTLASNVPKDQIFS
jgi:hypothetical protein